jgi:hypothetical protein
MPLLQDSRSTETLANLLDRLALAVRKACRDGQSNGQQASFKTYAKLAGRTFPALEALWDRWEPEMLQALFEAMKVWHEGSGYMYTQDDEFNEKTPFDAFAERYPEDWKDYADIVAAGAPKQALYRVLLHEQADAVVDKIVSSGNEDLLDNLWYELGEQNNLDFSNQYVTKDSFHSFPYNIPVRRFSGWTSKPSVAYKLSFQGGEEQIGDGAVILRTTANPRIVHTFDSATAFERWCDKHPEKVPNATKFMSRWTWQFEYVVEAASMTDRDVVVCDAVVVCAQESDSNWDTSGYYDEIREALGIEDES